MSYLKTSVPCSDLINIILNLSIKGEVTDQAIKNIDK